MNIPTREEVEENHRKLSSQMYQTPVLHWNTSLKEKLLGDKTKVFVKCELFQKTGTFKLRGALTLISSFNQTVKDFGIVAGSGGNHGIAVAYAAKLKGINAKIVIPKTINSQRLRAIEMLGAEIIKVDCISQILDEMNHIASLDKRKVVHPFEHPMITLGTATLSYEFLNQIPNLDVIICPIGGGGLISGVACGAKLINPNIKIFGVEPEGANSMSLSIRQGEPIKLQNGAHSIADSLCAPCSLPYSFTICKKFVDEIVTISDQEIRLAMKLLFEDLKLACEPACAASTAALLRPLKNKCLGLRVGLILCGSNIDHETFFSILSPEQ
jgi:threonine dehydratase